MPGLGPMISKGGPCYANPHGDDATNLYRRRNGALCTARSGKGVSSIYTCMLMSEALVYTRGEGAQASHDAIKILIAKVVVCAGQGLGRA